MSKPKILVVVGTTREGRSGRKVADWYMAEAQKIDSGLDLELLDLKDLDLPLFNEPMSPMWGKYSDVQKSLASKVGAADGFVFVTAEYNHSVSASLHRHDVAQGDGARQPSGRRPDEPGLQPAGRYP